MDVASCSDSYNSNHPRFEDVWFEILLRVPTRDLDESCFFVCKQMQRILKDIYFWKKKCIQDMEHPYDRNLIKNPDASTGLSEWQVICNGGVGWSVEANPNGSDPGTVGCWAASFGKCAKYQVVDLMAAGCSKHVLDHFRPAIHVSEWHSGRGNIEAEYNMTVELMSNKGDTFWIAPSGNMRYSVDVTLPAGRSDWHQIKHTFQDYPMGIRFVGFYHSGKNKEYSLMEKGPKMTLASVILDFKHVAGPAESRDDDV